MGKGRFDCSSAGGMAQGRLPRTCPCVTTPCSGYDTMTFALITSGAAPPVSVTVILTVKVPFFVYLCDPCTFQLLPTLKVAPLKTNVAADFAEPSPQSIVPL